MHIANTKNICDLRPNTGRPDLLCNRGDYKVFIHESNWQREDGQNTDREHLLMALADLSHIFIESVEDAGQVSRVGIQEVVLDISSETSSGNQVATSVEQCSCPKGKILDSYNLILKLCFVYSKDHSLLFFCWSS